MKPILLVFRVRTHAETSLKEMGERVGKALECSFIEESRDDDCYCLVSRVLHLVISLRETFSGDGKLLFALSGSVRDDEFFQDKDGNYVDVDLLQVDQAIAHILRVKGAGDWWVPSVDEIIAGGEYWSKLEEREREERERLDKRQEAED